MPRPADHRSADDQRGAWWCTQGGQVYTREDYLGPGTTTLPVHHSGYTTVTHMQQDVTPRAAGGAHWAEYRQSPREEESLWAEYRQSPREEEYLWAEYRHSPREER